MAKEGGEAVRVVIRCRPLNSKEKADGRERIVEMDTKIGQVCLKSPKGDAAEAPKQFTFDKVFDAESAQKDVYDNAARPIVNSVMEGYNGTIFAYGQTGTGKTHTMEGFWDAPEQRGIIPNSFEHVFSVVGTSSDTQWMVRASYLEIYNEEIRDLLSKDPKNKLELKENKEGGVYVKNLNAFVVKGVPELMQVLEVGKKNRSVGSTAMNMDSSRSHSIFMITVEQGANTGEGHIRVGKLNLVDLAGSERQSKTGATGDRLKEGIKINLSLTALGNVISALVDGKTGHIPYRDSKLTRLLQDSLGGNTKTVMVANLGPADWNYDETLSTLRYANRAKNIKNKPRINEDPKDAMLREYQDEITKLKAALEAANNGEGIPPELLGMEGPEEIEERVVLVQKPIDPAEYERIRTETESQLKRQMSKKLGGIELNKEQLDQLRAEATQKAQAEAERLEADKRKNEAEAAKYQKKHQKMQVEMSKKVEDAERIRQEKEALAKKLSAMQSKILKGEAHGGLAAVTKKKEEELKKKEHDLEQRRLAEEEKAKKIIILEEKALAQEEKYASLADEAEQKTKKLKKLYKKFQEVSGEVDDLYKEFQREKEDLLESIRMLQDQMQLKDMVIEAFIPQEEVQKVMRRAHWDEEREVWVLERLSDPTKTGLVKRPVSASGTRRPTSDFAKLANAMGDMNPRFRSENILNLELDMPERTTYDYAGPGVDPRVQAAINAAFADDGALLFVGSANEKMYLGDDVSAVAVPGTAGARPDSAAKRRPTSARRGSKA